jgi:hypothetical protein
MGTLYCLSVHSQRHITDLVLPYFIAIIATQQAKIHRMANEKLLGQVAIRGEYPIARPVFTQASEFRLPCTRKIFGLWFFPGQRGVINRHVWKEMQVWLICICDPCRVLVIDYLVSFQSTTRSVIASNRFFDKIKPTDNEWKKLDPTVKVFLRNEVRMTLVANYTVSGAHAFFIGS